ncbi:hypothetical protein V8C44DRAFT_315446 [Trichoderma aethiopicum]
MLAVVDVLFAVRQRRLLHLDITETREFMGPLCWPTDTLPMTTYCVLLPFPLFRQYCRFTHNALELASMGQRASTPWPHLAPRCHVVIHQLVRSPYNSPTHRQIAAYSTETLELESQFLPLDSSLSFVGRACCFLHLLRRR